MNRNILTKIGLAIGVVSAIVAIVAGEITDETKMGSVFFLLVVVGAILGRTLDWLFYRRSGESK